MRKNAHPLIRGMLLVFLLGSQVSAAAAEQSAPEHFFGICQVVTDTNCIESIFATLPTGEKIKAVHVKDTGPKNEWPVWKLSGAKFQDGEDTFVSQINWRRDGEALCWFSETTCSYHSGSIDLAFWPYGEGIAVPAIHFNHDSSDLQCGTASNPSQCGMWLNFGLNITWDLIFRADDFRPGMLGGRAKNSTFIDLDPQRSTSETHRYELVGTNYLQDTSVTSEIRNSNPGNRDYADAVSDGYIVWIWDSNNDAVLGRFPPKCMPNQLPGDISRFMFNTYNLGAPSWDSTNKTLSVTVQSPHFSADGSLASGYYEMYFPAAVAKCMWGVTDTGATKANVSITNGDGTLNVATISQTSDQNGLTVIASNFHFSSPTIRVKLTQDVATAASTPSPSATPNSGDSGGASSVLLEPVSATKPVVATPPKVITKKMVCVKGKVKKEIIGTQCPKGFKKAN